MLVALGVTPVLIEAPTWIPNGINPWLSEALGGQRPEGFTGADGLPLEQIANAEPDLIVGINSYGIGETYEQLSAIAPTVAWDEEQRQLPWQDQTRLIGQALGKSAEADALVSQTEATIAGFPADHPAVRGKSVLFAVGAYDGVLGIGVGDTSYNDLFTEMGMVVPDGFDPSVAENGLSFEQLDALQDLDIMIFQPTDQAEYDAFLGLRLAQTLPVVQKHGIVALLDPVDAGSTVIGIRKPTPLSIPWVFNRLGDRIEEAAVNSGA
ncbi:hypothetical protein BJF78_29555 [Pseudonocardia sp. CNS-139]|nr:hypothetical protein BJF78_29555 [Pseudonocardia sp. CNS-139]